MAAKLQPVPDPDDEQPVDLEAIAAQAEKVSSYALDVMWKAVDETRKKLVHGSLRDPSTAAKNLATTADLAAKQAQLIRGRPTQIVHDRSAEELLRSLEGKLPGIKNYDAIAEAVEENDEA